MHSSNYSYKLQAEVWRYPGLAAWHFLTLPKKELEEIKLRSGPMRRGWGSVRVNVTIGKTSWKTSIFPDKKSDAYLLPIKAEVRKKEKIKAGDIVNFTIETAGSLTSLLADTPRSHFSRETKLKNATAL